MEAADAAAILNKWPVTSKQTSSGSSKAKKAEAILSHMDPLEAADVRRLIDFDPDTAGGLMVTEFISFPENRTIQQIVSELKERKEEYRQLHIKYIYINRLDGTFAGVLQIQDLLLAEAKTKLSQIIIPDVITVPVEYDLEHLVDFSIPMTFTECR
ncbi:MAG: magnesium transporter [Saprospiraceae bacterium]|nr:magnesium transporter [Saprospiraceae bacterium]